MTVRTDKNNNNGFIMTVDSRPAECVNVCIHLIIYETFFLIGSSKSRSIKNNYPRAVIYGRMN